MSDIGRNDPCHCGSGKKYKKCHLETDEKSDRKDREKAALNAAKVMAAESEKAEKDEKSGVAAGAAQAKKPHDKTQPGWMQRVAGKMGFSKSPSQQRRTGPSSKGG